MGVTTTFSTKQEDTYVFRYQEEIVGEHGRKSIIAPPFHVTLTLPNGMVKINQYGYKENNTVEVASENIKALISMLQSVEATYEKMRVRRDKGA